MQVGAAEPCWGQEEPPVHGEPLPGPGGAGAVVRPEAAFAARPRSCWFAVSGASQGGVGTQDGLTAACHSRPRALPVSCVSRLLVTFVNPRRAGQAIVLYSCWFIQPQC